MYVIIVCIVAVKIIILEYYSSSIRNKKSLSPGHTETNHVDHNIYFLCADLWRQRDFTVVLQFSTGQTAGYTHFFPGFVRVHVWLALEYCVYSEYRIPCLPNFSLSSLFVMNTGIDDIPVGIHAVLL